MREMTRQQWIRFWVIFFAVCCAAIPIAVYIYWKTSVRIRIAKPNADPLGLNMSIGTTTVIP